MFLTNYFSAPKVVESFYGDPLQSPILGLTLEQRQDRAISICGGEWNSTVHETHKTNGNHKEQSQSGKLWIRRDCHVSQDIIQVFVAEIRNKFQKTSISQIIIPRITGRFGNLLSDLRFGEHGPLLFWCFEDIDCDSVFVQNLSESVQKHQEISAEEVITIQFVDGPLTWCWMDIDPAEKIYPMPVSRYQFGVDLIEIPLSDFIVIPTGHWMQLLWANLLSLGPFLYRELLGRSFGEVVVNLFKAFFQCWSFDPLTLGLQLRRIGKNVKIHPSAVVEACWIGDNVRIGANAVVRGSILADGVKIEDLALVEFSSLSSGVIIQRQAMVKFSVINKNCGIGGVIQLGVMDEGSLLKRGAYLMDMTLADGGVSIRYNDKSFGVPLGLGGCAIGTRTVIGCGVRIAAGRYIPSFAQIVADVDQSLLKIPKEIIERSQKKMEDLQKLQRQENEYEEPKQDMLICRKGTLDMILENSNQQVTTKQDPENR